MNQIYARGFWLPTLYASFWTFVWRLKNEGHIRPLRLGDRPGGMAASLDRLPVSPGGI